MRPWNWQQLHRLEFVTLPSWREQGLQAIFTARGGGVSSPPYDSLNLGLHVGDDPQKVIKNRQLIMQLFGLDLDHLVSCQQVHGDGVGIVTQGDGGRGAYSDGEALPGWDAMVTDRADLVLATFYADCIPLFFFDPNRRVIALAHSGWKGTYLGIAAKTVGAMVEHFGSDPGSIQVFVGPGIGPCCYRIGSELLKKVRNRFSNFSDIIYEDEQGHSWDLPATNRQILAGAGILNHNISGCPLCTCCEARRFFSYRRAQGQTGRMGAFMALQ